MDQKIDRRFSELDQKMDRRFGEVDQKFGALDVKLSRQFTWFVGLFVTTLVAIGAAAVAR